MEIKEQEEDDISFDRGEGDTLQGSTFSSMSLLKGSKKSTVVNEYQKDSNLVLSNIGTKKRTMFRMSGFANTYTKKSVPQQQSSLSLKQSAGGIESSNS